MPAETFTAHRVGSHPKSFDFPTGPSFLDNEVPCAQTDPSLFHPDKGGSVAAAKRICAGCPVTVACLEFALASEFPVDGVWAGTSERERRPMRRARRAA